MPLTNFNLTDILGKDPDKLIEELISTCWRQFRIPPTSALIIDSEARRALIKLLAEKDPHAIAMHGDLLPWINSELYFALKSWTANGHEEIQEVQANHLKVDVKHRTALEFLQRHFADLPMYHEPIRRFTSRDNETELSVGDILEFKTYSCFSSFGGSFLFARSQKACLVVHANTRGRRVGGLSAEKCEDEVLIPPSKYKVVRLENNRQELADEESHWFDCIYLEEA